MEIVEVVTRCDDVGALERIADTLVIERFAASAHVRGPVRSVYRWHGELVTTSEFELDFDTTVDRADAAVARLVELHPYDTAATVMRTATVGERYATWVHAQTTPHE